MKNKLLSFLLMLIIFLIFANLLASNRLANAGGKIEAMEVEIERLTSENSSWELEIARSASISGLIKRAEELGFTFSPKVFYLKGKIPVAMR